MDGNQRREEILRILEQSAQPVSGQALAKLLKVSRQVIVQDIALLRADKKDILSTARGYLLYPAPPARAARSFTVTHTTEQIADELYTIVDLGGKVQDVTVSHSIYGSISAPLIICSRKDVDDFVTKVRQKHTVPLKELTDGVHVHRVEADSEETLDRIQEALKEKNYLIPT